MGSSEALPESPWCLSLNSEGSGWGEVPNMVALTPVRETLHPRKKARTFLLALHTHTHTHTHALQPEKEKVSRICHSHATPTTSLWATITLGCCHADDVGDGLGFVGAPAGGPGCGEAGLAPLGEPFSPLQVGQDGGGSVSDRAARTTGTALGAGDTVASRRQRGWGPHGAHLLRGRGGRRAGSGD